MVYRTLNLLKLLGDKRSTFLFGPRGVGKTFLAEQFITQQPSSMTINLLNLDLYRRYVTDPSLFRKEIENKLTKSTEILTVLVDEVQKFPDLLNEVHYLIEKYKNKVRFVLTGSSARKLKRTGVNLLAGRAWTLYLHPLTTEEVDLDLDRSLRFGTLPAIYLEEDNPTRSLKSYVETYLKEEIFQEALVRNNERFVRFLDLAGQLNGEPINNSAVARDAGVSSKTINEYYSILEDTLVAFRISPWSYSIRKQLSHSSKFYFFDCGVLNAITGELGDTLRAGTARFGKLFETFLITEIVRLNDYFEGGYRFYYWRTNSGQEVDLILSTGTRGKPIAIEIKSRPDPGEPEVKGLLAFASENKNSKLICLCQTPHSYQLGQVSVLPWRQGLKEIFSQNKI